VEVVGDRTLLDRLRVGDVQDTNNSFTGYVLNDSGEWSPPKDEADFTWRTLTARDQGPNTGYVVFSNPIYTMTSGLMVRARLRLSGPQVELIASLNGNVVGRAVATTTQTWEWVDLKLLIDDSFPTGQTSASGSLELGRRRTSRWGEAGAVMITKVAMEDLDGHDTVLVASGDSVVFVLGYSTESETHVSVLPSLTLTRADGIQICHFFGEVRQVKGNSSSYFCRVLVEDLLLADGEYLLSASLFDKVVSAETRYDLLARSYAFKVTGNNTLQAGSAAMIRHQWIDE
jgi:hypothetical protein